MFIFLTNHSGNAAVSLSDIPEQYAPEINYLLNQEVISGYPDRTFKPNNNVTREEAATMIGIAKGFDGTKRPTSFPDVGAGSYASGYIQSAVEKGIITGHSDNTFRPKDPITRGQMAIILQRAFNLDEKSNVNFSDVYASGTQYDAIDRITTAGLAAGFPDGTFQPDSPVTRAHYALFVARGLNPDFRVSYIGKPIKEAIVNVGSGDVLNVRSGPSTNNSIIGSYKDGTQVNIYRYEGDWAYVSSGSITGYVNSYYLGAPSSGKKIAIDAGHGGSDTGAIGNGLLEKEINLSIALKVESLLKQKGIQVVMTRNNDTFISLDGRVAKAVNANADSFVSIHTNSSTSPDPSGTETYYSTAATRSENSKQLATFIQNRLYPALGTKDRKVKTADFRVIYKTPLPATLVELGFISNSSDSSKLASGYYRNKAAEAIALGIEDYYNWKK